MPFDFDIRPHEEAAALVRGKSVVAADVFKALLPEARGRAFTITGVEGAHVLQRVRDRIADYARGGEGNTWDDAKADIISSLDPWLGDGAERRATILLRTHGFQAFQAANWRVAQEDEDTTHLQYLATEDDRVRESHLALNGIILPKNDPFWEKHYPPWEWGCRCRVRPMNPDLVDLAREQDAERNPEDRLVLEGAALRELRHGRLIRESGAYDVTAPSDSADGEDAFQWHPDDLRITPSQVRQHFDSPVFAAFKHWAQLNAIRAGLTLWQWLRGV